MTLATQDRGSPLQRGIASAGESLFQSSQVPNHVRLISVAITLMLPDRQVQPLAQIFMPLGQCALHLKSHPVPPPQGRPSRHKPGEPVTPLEERLQREQSSQRKTRKRLVVD